MEVLKKNQKKSIQIITILRFTIYLRMICLKFWWKFDFIMKEHKFLTIINFSIKRSRLLKMMKFCFKNKQIKKKSGNYIFLYFM